MADETLSILVDIVDEYSDELTDLAAQLIAIDGLAETVEDIVIDVDVRGQGELAALQGQMAAVEGADVAGVGDVAPDVTPSGGGGGVAMTEGGVDAGGLDAAISDLRRNLGTLGDLTGNRRDISEVVDGDAFRRALTSSDFSTVDFVRGDIELGDLDIGRDELFDFSVFERADSRFGRLINSVRDVDLSMRDFYDVLAALLPLIFVFVGAIPAAITAIGALATAALGAAAGLGAIAGLGVMGLAMQESGGGMPSMEDFSAVFEDVREDIFDALAPLAERFAPLAEDALEGVVSLFEELARNGQVLDQFADDARAFGGFLLDTIPPLLTSLVRLGDAFGPIFGMMASWVQDADIIGGMVDTFRKALPDLKALTGAIIEFIPLLIEFSMGFLRAATAASVLIVGIIQLVDWVADLFGIVEGGSAVLGAFVGVVLTAYSAIALVSRATAVWGAVTRYLSGTVIAEAIGRLSSYIATLTGVTVSTTTLYAVTAAFIGLLTLGLVPVVSSLAGEFDILGGNIDDATEALDRFGRTREGIDAVGGGSVGGGGGSTNIYQTEYNREVTVNGGSGEQSSREQKKQSYIDRTFSSGV